MNPPLPTSTHLYPPLPTSIHLCPPLPTSTHLYPPLPTSTHPLPTLTHLYPTALPILYPPLPTLTHLYPPLPTSTHLYPPSTQPLPTLTHLYRALPSSTHPSLPLTTVHRSVRVVYGVQLLTTLCSNSLKVHCHTNQIPTIPTISMSHDLIISHMRTSLSTHGLTTHAVYSLHQQESVPGVHLEFAIWERNFLIKRSSSRRRCTRIQIGQPHYRR